MKRLLPIAHGRFRARHHRATSSGHRICKGDDPFQAAVRHPRGRHALCVLVGGGLFAGVI